VIRLIVHICDTSAAEAVGGPVVERYQTFDVELPEVERILRESPRWAPTRIVGAELLQPKEGA